MAFSIQNDLIKGVLIAFLFFIVLVSPVLLSILYTANPGYRNKTIEHDFFECSLEFEKTVFNATRVFIPGTSLTGKCKKGYVALYWEIIATCNTDYQATLSDTCRQLLINVAVGNPARQSSTHSDSGPEKAVDGIRNTDLIDGVSCTHTVADSYSWWLVDLLKEYYIISERMLNRGPDRSGIDTSDRLRNVTITTRVHPNYTSIFCGFYAGPGKPSELVRVDCPPL